MMTEMTQLDIPVINNRLKVTKLQRFYWELEVEDLKPLEKIKK